MVMDIYAFSQDDGCDVMIMALQLVCYTHSAKELREHHAFYAFEEIT